MGGCVALQHSLVVWDSGGGGEFWGLGPSPSLRPGCLFLNQSYSDDRILFLNLKFSNCTYLDISTSCFSSNKSLFFVSSGGKCSNCSQHTACNDCLKDIRCGWCGNDFDPRIGRYM